MHTPFFPQFRARLAPLGKRVHTLRRQSLPHLDLLFGPLLLRWNRTEPNYVGVLTRCSISLAQKRPLNTFWHYTPARVVKHQSSP